MVFLYLLEVQEDIKLSLDCAQVGFLEEDTLVLSLKNGELYVLTLLADNMRYVRSFHFEKAAASVLTTCVRFNLYLLISQFNVHNIF